MTTDDAPHVSSGADEAAEILDRALAVPPDDLEAFLDSACSGDVELRAQIVTILRAHAEATGFLEPRLLERGCDAFESIASHHVGDTIGRYRLVKVVGEGGFGIVYLAEQHEPLKRQVALKVIKLGMDTRQVIARFEAERQALAMMDHPGIARVFDAGATPAGRPYFVMELVEGVPITDYCDEKRLDPRARLLLFVQVCLAVQHAHQKGIIHRDLKPSNVLVSTHDGVPSPKVIDFGVAKATNAEETGRTMFTEHRQIVGTPAYMSPEHAGATGQDIDTRSDVYALGVLLYELLTGTTPFDAKQLLSAGFDEMMRIIREEDPVRPSTRIATLGDAGTHLAGLRHSEIKKLRTILHGDLDWIVMKCLEKDRTQRYATSSALAEDVQRFLAAEPVVARAHTAAYRVRKFVHRNRAAVITGTMMAAILIVATAVSIAFALRESAARKRESAALAREVEERERADIEAEEARRQALAAEEARALAKKHADETNQVAGFQAELLRTLDAEALGRGIRDVFRDQLRLTLEREPVGKGPERRARTPEEIEGALSDFDDLTLPIAAADVARRVMDEHVLSAAAKTVAERFTDQPLVQAQIHDALGAAYRALGLFEPARSHYQNALDLRRSQLGGQHPEVAHSLNNVATMIYHQGDFTAAESLCLEALAINRRALGDHHPDVATTLHNLATLHLQKGDLHAAEPYLRQAIDLLRAEHGDENQAIIPSLYNLAGLLYSRGDVDGAETAYRDVLRLQREWLGEDHADVGLTLQNLAIVSGAKGDIAEAEALFREALAVLKRRHGRDHPEVGGTLSNLAFLLKRRGDLTQAEACYREALAIRRKTLPPMHIDIANTLNNLAVLLRDRGDYALADPLYREAIAIQEAGFPDGHPMTANSRAGLGRTLVRSASDASLALDDRRARLSEAEALLLSAEKDLSEAVSALPIFRQRTLESLVELYTFRNTIAPGEGFDAEAEAWREKLGAPATPNP